MIKQILNFCIHLRPHYQVLILSGGYLLGGVMADTVELNTKQYWLQFLNIHILLFGGATAYNSFWDKDKGPIGGLKNPPKMSGWMHPASLLLQVAGFVFTLYVGWLYSVIYLVSFLLFWLYSTPLARWKGDPVLSVLVIGISTGINSVLLGSVAAGGTIHLSLITASIGATLILLSLYPVSQIFQTEEDKARGDTTFAVKFGIKGVKNFFTYSFLTGVLFISSSFKDLSLLMSVLFAIVGTAAWVFLMIRIRSLRGVQEEYKKVMIIKFTASLSFVIFLILAILLKYQLFGITIGEEIF